MFLERRGQTIPFWAFGTLLVLTLLFFVINYADTVRWQVRAQNAADSSAVAKLSDDAAILNSYTLLLYAANLQSLKSQAIVSSVNALLRGQTTCGVSGLGCLDRYSTAIATTTSHISALAAISTQLATASGQLSALASDPHASVSALSGQSCVKLQTDCSFTYTTIPTLFPVGAPPLTVAIDEFSCRRVYPVAMRFLHLGGPFYAIGHASIQLSPLAQTLTPGVAAGPHGLTDLGKQTLLPGIAGASGASFEFDPTQLRANVGLLVAKPSNAPIATQDLAALEATCA